MENCCLNALTTPHYSTYHQVVTFYSIIISNMFLGCGIMVVGPRRSDGRPRAKGFCGVGMEVWKPKWMSRRKTLNAVSDDCPSYDEVPPSHASGESGFEDYLPGIVASYPGELLKRYQERRSRGRQSGALLPESVAEEEHHEGSGTMNKE